MSTRSNPLSNRAEPEPLGTYIPEDTCVEARWQAGTADIDQSGGTDGDDIADFFARWQAGC